MPNIKQTHSDDKDRKAIQNQINTTANPQYSNENVQFASKQDRGKSEVKR